MSDKEMTMVERVARRIWNIRREEEDRCDMELEDMGEDHSVWAEARAAIEEMRVPTKAMKEAGEAEIPFHPESEGDEEDDVWRAMIDAALNEKES